jgi:poly-beta-1,6-N-acetyl-D-glucosamine synthase
MIKPIEIVCCLSGLAILYAYVGYPLALLALRIVIHRPVRKAVIAPSVTLIVPALNEAKIIEAKMQNVVELDYPAGMIEVIVASDGSTDETVELARQFCEGRKWRVLNFPRNRGKMWVINEGVRAASGEIIVLSDASAMMTPDAVRLLVANFADPEVGAVSGMYRIHRAATGQLGRQEELYWRYETFLKIQESAVSSVLGGHGAILALRKSLFPYPGAETINDDYVIPLRIVAGGHRVVYEPRAIAFEEAAATVGFQRRVRIMAGNLQQLKELRGLLRPLRVVPLFCFISHKAMRTAVPFFMFSLAISNAFQLSVSGWRLLAAGQLCFYALALLGIQWELRPRVLRLPYYFCFVNTAYLWGALRSLQGVGKVSWK